MFFLAGGGGREGAGDAGVWARAGRAAAGLTPGLTADPSPSGREGWIVDSRSEFVFALFMFSRRAVCVLRPLMWRWCATVEGRRSGGEVRAGGVTARGWKVEGEQGVCYVERRG
jgi:hypothetical protein